MKRLIFIFIVFLPFLSCNTNNNAQNITKEEKIKVQNTMAKVREGMKNMEQEKVRRLKNELGIDTTGDSESPLMILNAKFIPDEYTNRRNVRVKYKNISGKKIVAIKIKWTGRNAFGEPASMRNSINGIGGGMTDDPINPGATESKVWDVWSTDGKNIIHCWAYEVVFADGTKWHHK